MSLIEVVFSVIRNLKEDVKETICCGKTKYREGREDNLRDSNMLDLNEVGLRMQRQVGARWPATELSGVLFTVKKVWFGFFYHIVTNRCEPCLPTSNVLCFSSSACS